MSDLISRQAAIDAMCDACSDWCDEGVCKKVSAIQKLSSTQPDRGYIEQIKWERDLAIQQLADLGYSLGEKPRMSGDTISRQAAIDLVRDVCDAVMSGCESWYDPETEDEVYKDIREVDAILKCNKEVRIALRNMQSAQPETANIIVGKSRDGMTMWYQCDNCNEPVDENDLYCRGCGRRFEHGSDR